MHLDNLKIKVSMRSRLLLAVDIDEVLAYHNKALAAWHNQQYGTDHTADDYFTEYWSKVWNVSSEEAEARAVAFHASGAHARLQLVKGALDALQRLHRFYDLAVITVRRQQVIEATRAWIDLYYPAIFTDIHFLHFWDKNENMTKAQLCRNIGASYLIDDSIKHCTQAAELGINALLFGDYSWNQATQLPKHIQRAANWGEVLKILDNPAFAVDKSYIRGS
jgi:uncharacterized HAD superfamily protein